MSGLEAVLREFPFAQDRVALDYIWSRVNRGPYCWEWTGTIDHEGYGIACVKQRKYRAHRVTFALTKGPIPEGLVIDHICRNRGCVRPEHLRAISNLENLLCGQTKLAAARAQTHCPQGHPLSGQNLYRDPSSGARRCKTCDRDAWRRRAVERRRTAQVASRSGCLGDWFGGVTSRHLFANCSARVRAEAQLRDLGLWDQRGSGVDAHGSDICGICVHRHVHTTEQTCALTGEAK